MTKLEEILKAQITGEWGTECEDGSGINVLRTTNFTNNGEINYSSVVKRTILDKKVETKRLIEGDIILEKSGGSDTIPVGRVVFCDKRINEFVYLCNNFTQTLRVDTNIAVAKYVFYFLLFQHKRGYTELLQNKTTGIRNLQLKQYMKMEIPIISMEGQMKIVRILDEVVNLISLRKKQIEKLDLLVKSRFVEMFGNILYDNHFDRALLQEVADVGSSKRIYANEYTTEGIPFYRSKEIRELGEGLKPSVELFISKAKYEETKSKYGIPKKGDILVAAIGATIGYTWVVDIDSPFYYKDGNLIQVSFKNDTNSIFFNHALKILIEDFKAKNATGSAQLAMTIEKMQKMEIISPPVELQNKFALFVEQVDKLKFEMQKSLDEMNMTYKALMQKYFG